MALPTSEFRWRKWTTVSNRCCTVVLEPRCVLETDKENEKLLHQFHDKSITLDSLVVKFG
jgi:hypothetical protein